MTWQDGRHVELDYRTIRSGCRCADCRVGRARSMSEQEWCDQFPEDLTITSIRPVGHYALQLLFSDGHDRGIYPWALFRDFRIGVSE